MIFSSDQHLLLCAHVVQVPPQLWSSYMEQLTALQRQQQPQAIQPAYFVNQLRPTQFGSTICWKGLQCHSNPQSNSSSNSNLDSSQHVWFECGFNRKLHIVHMIRSKQFHNFIIKIVNLHTNNIITTDRNDNEIKNEVDRFRIEI